MSRYISEHSFMLRTITRVFDDWTINNDFYASSRSIRSEVFTLILLFLSRISTRRLCRGGPFITELQLTKTDKQKTPAPQVENTAPSSRKNAISIDLKWSVNYTRNVIVSVNHCACQRAVSSISVRAASIWYEIQLLTVKYDKKYT